MGFLIILDADKVDVAKWTPKDDFEDMYERTLPTTNKRVYTVYKDHKGTTKKDKSFWGMIDKYKSMKFVLDEWIIWN